jgi:hypothetical protein
MQQTIQQYYTKFEKLIQYGSFRNVILKEARNVVRR